MPRNRRSVRTPSVDLEGSAPDLNDDDAVSVSSFAESVAPNDVSDAAVAPGDLQSRLLNVSEGVIVTPQMMKDVRACIAHMGLLTARQDAADTRMNVLESLLSGEFEHKD